MDDDFKTLLEQIKSGGSISQGEDHQLSNYEKFLQALRQGKHPPFCELIWNGEAFHVTLMIHFQRAPEVIKPPGPEADIFRQEAYRCFKRLGAVEQKIMSIRVTIKHWLPVNAEVTIRPEAAGVLRISTAQLLDFQNP